MRPQAGQTMQFSKDETLWATYVHPDDTAHTAVIRHGDNPDEDDAAYEVALQLVALHEVDRDGALEAVDEHRKALVRKYFLAEIRLRTEPGYHRERRAQGNTRAGR